MITVISTTILVRLCHMLYAQSVRKDFYGLYTEVGIEAEGSTVKFQSLSAAQGRVYRCDSCGKEFVKVDNEFLELKYSKNPN